MTDEERIEAIEETEEVEDVPEIQMKPGRMKKLKTQLHQVVDNMNDKDSARIRAKFLDRWAELSGLEKTRTASTTIRRSTTITSGLNSNGG